MLKADVMPMRVNEGCFCQADVIGLYDGMVRCYCQEADVVLLFNDWQMLKPLLWQMLLPLECIAIDMFIYWLMLLPSG